MFLIRMAVFPPMLVQYVVIDQDGRTYSGLIAAETATSLGLRRRGGAEDIILRAPIAEMTSTGLSLIPEGMEKKILKLREDRSDHVSASIAPRWWRRRVHFGQKPAFRYR